MSFRKITILGNVGQAPEIKKLPSGVIVANFSIATNDNYMSKGEKVQKTTWFRVDAFQKAERGLVTDVIQKYVGAGQMLMIEGSPEIDEYEKGGVKQRAFKIRIGHPGSSLQLCGTAKGAHPSGGETSGPATTDTSESAPSSGDDDEIPF
jgi:single-strand DNA-binding protein